MKNEIHYDIIGDVHGRIDKLEALLPRLGYHHDGISYVPPAGRRALFVGDLIDPKPGIAIPGGVRATLELVKAMHDRGHALCLMGNHEVNAIFYHTRGREVKWLRQHGDRNKRTHQGTLDDFPDHKDAGSEWQITWMPWLKRLPLYLELDGFRAVHASWHPEHLARLRGRSFEDEEFLHAAADPHSPEGEAIEMVLKGLEIPLPLAVSYHDHTGTQRRNFRAKWWEKPSIGSRLDELVFPMNPQIPDTALDAGAERMFQGYADHEPPVFFGHYFKPADSPLEPERPNVACLDHSAAKDGPLVAYRWSGEREINPNHYLS